MDPLLVAFVAVFLAEFGDKTEILTLALAARYGPWPVLAGVTLTTALLNVVSVTVGVGLARAIPARAVTVLAGATFLAFAVWSGRSDSRPLAVDGHPSSLAVVARSAALFAVSEVGDKTMLATIALAAHGSAARVWAGSTAGIVAAEAIAVLVGARLGDRLSRRAVRTGSALVFAGMGVALLARAALR